jgi:hypothetical protein
MSHQTPVLETKNPLPPEERFWKRYSPQHEFPLSSAGSVVLHVLAVGALVVVGYVLTRTNNDEPTAPPLMSVVALTKGDGGSGGKDPGRDESLSSVKADEVAKDANPPQPGSKLPEAVRLKDVEVPFLSIKPSDSGQRLIVGQDKTVIDDLDALIERTRGGLNKPAAPVGRPNVGPRPGRLGGNPPGELTREEKRRARWKMFFPTAGGADYLKQLRGLRAILAFPLLKGNGQIEYLVIRDIKPRAVGRREDVNKLNLIFWFDKEPGSVLSVAQALGLNNPPPFFVAFFPKELEDRLRALEQQAYSGDEDRIIETRFRVERDGEVYRPVLDGANAVVLKRD